MANELTVKQQSVDQIRQFIDNVGSDSKILARKNSHGDLVLYERPHAKNVFDRIAHSIDRQSGKTDRRTDRAWDQLKTVLTTELNNLRKEVAYDRDVTKLFRTSIQDQRAKGAVMGSYLKDVSEIVRVLPGKVSEPDNIDRTLGLGKLFPQQSKTLFDSFGDITNDLKTDPTQARELGKQLGDAMRKEFIGSNPSNALKDTVAYSDGETLRQDIKAKIVGLINADPGTNDVEEEAVDSLVNEALKSFLSGILTDKAVPPTTRLDGTVDPKSMSILMDTGKSRTMPNITIGGTEYEPKGFYGSGGFADVFEYAQVGKPDNKIALKVTKDPDLEGLHKPEQRAKLIKGGVDELAQHRAVLGQSGCNEIIGLVGSLRMPDGSVAVAIESAPHGDVFAMSGELQKLVKSNVVTEAEANIVRLTMIKDMVRGLDHMHSKQGEIHFDFKSPNCFIGSDGTVRVADFGTTIEASGKRVGFDPSHGVEQPRFLAPELVHAKRSVSDISGVVKDRIKTLLGKMLPKAGDGALTNLGQSVFSNKIQKALNKEQSDRSKLFFDSKVDIWGLGASASHLFSGRQIGHQHAFNSSVEDDLVNFRAKRGNAPLSDPDSNGNPQNGSIALKTGDRQIDDLLSKMLMPDPRDRWSTSQLLKHPALNTQGDEVDSKARSLIVALKSGDPTKISRAKQDLDKVTLVVAPKQGVDSSSQSQLSVDPKFLVTPEDMKMAPKEGTDPSLQSMISSPSEQVDALDAWTDAMPPLPQTPPPGAQRTGGEDDEKV